MANGKLIVNAKKQIRVKFTNSKGKEVEMAVSDAELSAALKHEPVEKLNGRDVELDEEKGQPRRVRPGGEPFAAAPSPSQRPQQGGRGPKRTNAPSQRHQQGKQLGPQPQAHAPQQPEGAFHNPYNFVPAPPRNTTHVDLGDHAPIGHHRYHGDRISGVIRVSMTLKTPLLLPDAAGASVDANDHKSFPVRVGPAGQPYIPPTSIKGMLRSAYEAVTNSRLAVFPGREGNAEAAAGHGMRLAYRMAANEGLSLVPAHVEGEVMVLLPGTSRIGDNGRPNGPMYAAWLRRYPDALSYPDGSLPAHGDQVFCWVERIQHFQPDFQLWGVRTIARSEAELGPCPTEFQQQGQRQGKYQRLGECLSICGYVCITNRNIDRKHDERVFFVHRQGEVRLPLTPALRQSWDELVSNYRSTHEQELAERARRGERPDQYLGREPGRTAWSRHVYQAGEDHLTDGSLCYAALDRERSVVALYPVMISRKLYALSPLQLLPRTLQPAANLQELSPADRVFGWVSQKGQGAYRGNVRIGPVTCESPDAIERFGEPGLPLAILGQPKEQQARFYVAASPGGEAQNDGLSKEEAGYRPGKGLRGRKVYPHHRSLPEGHWIDPMTDRKQTPNGGHFQEYRRPSLNGQDRDNQNRSIHGWVKPGTTFAFDLNITNLSMVELGALLWLLSLQAEHYHRLGGGKPLGFGSVRLEIDKPNTHLHDGNGWKDFYSTLDPCSPPEVDREAMIASFQNAVIAAYGPNQVFVDVSIIKAFLRMAEGFAADILPIHYPRARQQGQTDPVPPNPEGRAYEWFVANDRTGQASLQDLASDSGLPMLDAPRQGG